MSIELLIVTGYLGSGKTTLVKSLAQTLPGQKCHFIVNEMGDVALDAAAYELVEDTATVVAGGCACCVRKDALIASIANVLATSGDKKTDDGRSYVVVETSGLANPAPIIFSIKTDPYLSHHVSVAGVVCVMGSVEGHHALQRYPEVAQQLAMADAVVLSKTDLVSPGRLQTLEQALSGVAVRCPRFFAARGAVDWRAILAHLGHRQAVDAQCPAVGPAAQPATAPTHPGHGTMSSCVLRFARPLDWVAFGVWLSALLATHGESIVRVKGVIKVADWDDAHFFVLINGVQHIMFAPRHVDGDDLPEHSALVFILKNIAPETVVQSLRVFHHNHVGGDPVPIWLE